MTIECDGRDLAEIGKKEFFRSVIVIYQYATRRDQLKILSRLPNQ
jgi:hypothetical protein